MTEHAVIGYCHPGTLRAEFAASVLETILTGPVKVDTVLSYQSGPNISTARNKICHEFLTKHRAPWLLMCDTDMVFAADALGRLITAANEAKAPVVGALCYSQDDGADCLPVMYELVAPDAGQMDRIAFVRLSSWAEGTLVRVSATGAAFLAIRRDALREIAAKSGDQAAPWFRESPVGAPLALMGEDMTFCLRAAAAGIPVHVHTGVQVGHMKPVMLGKVT